MTVILSIIYTTILLICLNSCSHKQGPVQKKGWDRSIAPPPVEVIEVTPSTFIESTESVGSLESPNTVEITSDNEGKIIEIDIPEGKLVNKEHILAQIDDSTNIAEIKVATAKLKNAKENYERMKSLEEEGAISKQAFDNALEVLESTEGEFERIESIQTMSTIKAPFDGVLSFKKVSLGTYIDPGDPIVRISQINPLDLIFTLPEKYIGEVKIGQKVKFKVAKLEPSKEKEFIATISVIDPYIDKETRTVQIKAKATNPNRELLPGQFANVKLELKSHKDAITIPEEALIQEGNEKKVFTVSPEGKVKAHKVKTGNWNEDSILILSGIMTGDTVITSGHQKLRVGMKVIKKPFKKIDNKNLDIGLNTKD